ncbi:zeta toxin family protein [soil metagenome]
MPNLFIIAGCNGAGKTTAYPNIIEERYNCKNFVNADIIAKEMSDSDPGSKAISAGKEFFAIIGNLIGQKADFAFETTLASRSLINIIKKCKEQGYKSHLVFFWLNNYETASTRVKSRVKEGGHNIPDDVIQRRYYRGINNLIEIYIPICDYWIVLDNSELISELICEGETGSIGTIYSDVKWQKIKLMSHDK